jgi:uncharacterized repeat protein (TIGR03837 family)
MPTLPPAPCLRWDIFCNVIDNYGDIGVCWRLARQLASLPGTRVRLWVDDLPRLHALCPEIDVTCQSQHNTGVEIRTWHDPFALPAPADLPDIVIEAFGCQLPDAYLQAMAQRRPAPVWVNLEYLSAEAWVEGCHGLASPHPQLPLTRHFFFPGFTAAAGGLLREAQLLAQRDAWQAQPAQASQRFGLPPATPDELTLSLFCYDNPALPALLAAWSSGERPVRCLVPAGRALTQIEAYLCPAGIPPGQSIRHGALTLHALPFLRQEDYDLLLWSCDLNFVRGEDSFVRAQWAARPLLWHIYPQQDNAHQVKLDAFLERYCATLSTTLAAPHAAFWRAWNNGDTSSMSAHWHACQNALPQLKNHAKTWSQQLASQEDLATQLQSFCQKLL